MVRGQCHNRSMRFFNTEGPVRPDKHYAIPPLDRVDIDEFLGPDSGGTLLRAARTAADGQDLRAHRPARPAQQRRGRQLPLRGRQRRGRSGGARRHRVRPPRHSGSLAENAQELGDNYPQEVWPDILAKVWGLTTHSSGCSPAGAAGGRDRLAGGDTLLSVLRQLRAGLPAAPRRLSRRAWCCAGCATSATTASGRAPARGLDAAVSRMFAVGRWSKKLV